MLGLLTQMIRIAKASHSYNVPNNTVNFGQFSNQVCTLLLSMIMDNNTTNSVMQISKIGSNTT